MDKPEVEEDPGVNLGVGNPLGDMIPIPPTPAESILGVVNIVSSLTSTALFLLLLLLFLAAVCLLFTLTAAADEAATTDMAILHFLLCVTNHIPSSLGGRYLSRI